MNDDELTTLVKEPFADVHMTMPLDQVARRGRAVRTHRRLLRGLTGAVALAGAAVAAVALLVPGGHPVTPKLAAWTVTTFPDGGIKVSVDQMKDPAGLQARLRADGIPARVTFESAHCRSEYIAHRRARVCMMQPRGGLLPAGCKAADNSANSHVLEKISTPPAIWSWQQQSNGGEPSSTQAMPESLQRLQLKETWAKGYPAIYINPAAIPPGIGLDIGADISSRSLNFMETTVVASPQCTGS
jgi:hypothetical protein